MSKNIPLSVPNLKGNELKYVMHAVETEWVSTAGPYITEFEEKIAKYLNVDGAVACQSGTSGLHLALQTSGVKAGDEVIVPTLTFIAAVNPVKYIGAEPIFMDCDGSLTMDSKKVRAFCEQECEYKNGILLNKHTGRQIKAMIVVHVFGNLANMEELTTIAEEYGLKLIEDATEALGSYYTEGKYAGRYAGTIGDVGVYSFNGNKIITTGGGGMIVAKNPQVLAHCRSLSTQAKRDTLYFDHEEIGYNYRMTNLQAALGLAQLEQLEDFIAIKKRNYEEYQNCGISLLPFRKGTRPNYWFYSYLTDGRDKLIHSLQEKGIQTRPVWKLIHTLDMYQGAQTFCIDTATRYYERIVNIPCSSNLSTEDVKYVADQIQLEEGKV